ncbi:MAG: hypothetical protein K6G91_03490 [Kiritimatiellae bacterium]|nr:hypothetical protein [Kiritimatiellia bacterium]
MNNRNDIVRRTLTAAAAGFLAMSCAGTVVALDGEGTAENPFLIHNVEELEFFAASVNNGESDYNESGKVVALACDIDLDGEIFDGIGDFDYPFFGDFDGRGHTIHNLSFVLDWHDCAGFIREIEGGHVSNINFEDVCFELNEDWFIGWRDCPYWDIYAYTGVAVGFALCSEIRNISVGGMMLVIGDEFTERVVGSASLDVVDCGNTIEDCTINVYRFGDEPPVYELWGDDVELPDANECLERTYVILRDTVAGFDTVAFEELEAWFDGAAELGETLTLQEFLNTPDIYAAFCFNLPYNTFAEAAPFVNIVKFSRYSKPDGNWADIVVKIQAGNQVLPIDILNGNLYVRYGSSPDNLCESVTLSWENVAYGTDGSLMLRVPPPAGNPENGFFQVSLNP